MLSYVASASARCEIRSLAHGFFVCVRKECKMLLLLILFSSVCVPALSDTQCVLPLLMTLGNDSNYFGNCQNAGASECDGSETTYIGSLEQCENPHEPISGTSYTAASWFTKHA